MVPKLSPGFVKNDTWISLWRENNIYIVQNWRLEAYIGKRSTLCLQNTFDAPCQRRLMASCCIKRIRSLNYYGTGLHKLWHPCILAARKWRENEEMKRNSLSTFTHYLFISSLSLHFLYLSKFVTFCRKHFCCECHKKLIICAMRKYGTNSLRGSSISCASLAGSHFFWYW